MSRRISKVRAVAMIDRTHITEDTTRAGEYVRLLGDAGMALAGIFRISLHALNTKTGSDWIEMREVNGTRQFRAVRPAMIRPARKAELRSRGLTQPTIPNEESA